MRTALPTPAPYPTYGGSAVRWKCEGTTTTTNGVSGSTAVRADECVVVEWASFPAPLSTLSVSNFPARQPVTVENFPAYPTPLATVAVSRVATGTIETTGDRGTVTSKAECGTAQTVPCDINLAATAPDLTALYAVVAGLVVMCLMAGLVALVRR